ncbi:MAG TPA: WD40 repeat domain-containing protein [Verrucomicrobiae bacterium]|nr:WD40 repeat domain-containing protein [Verrucomicrobiae bacterium]
MAVLAAPSPQEILKPNLTIPGDNSHPAAVIAYNQDGRFLAVGSTDGAVRVYDARHRESIAWLTQTLTGHTAPILAIGFKDTNTLVSVSLDQTTKLWDVTSGKLLHSTQLDFGKQLVPAIAPGGEPFLAGGTLKQVRLWNYQTGALLHSFEANDSSVAALAFTPDGKLLVIGTTKGVVRVMDVAAWKVTRTIDLDTPVRSIATSLDHIAVGYFGGAVALLDFGDQPEVPEVDTQSGAILALAFSPDGEQFAVASADQTVKVWDMKKLKLLGSLDGQSGEVLSVAFSPNGHEIASGSADGTVNYWTVQQP